MKRFEIIDHVEDLGFQLLSDMLLLSNSDSNYFTYSDCIGHINSVKNECTEEEFPACVYNELVELIDLYFSL